MYIILLVRGCVVTSIAILAVLSIYWGAMWRIEDGIHNLNGWVVDFDGQAMGQAVQAAAMNVTGPKNRISWTVIPASNFPNGPSDVTRAVVDEKCWVAIVVNPKATTNLTDAVSSADASYNGSSAVTIYGIEARNENVYPLVIAPMAQNLMNMAAKVFGDQHAQQLASNPNISTLLSTAPGVMTQPMYYTLINIRPFDVTAASAADFVGLIYLLIISFLTTNLTFGARMETGLARHLSLKSLVKVRILSAIIMYFFLSLIFALLSLAFQIPFSRKFGPSGFVIFWILCWAAMCALGLALEAVITLVTPRYTPYFMILWIIIDVSVSYYPIEILPAVYRYGYAAPFYNVSRAVKTIIFSTRDQVGLNFGVEFAWVAVSLMTLPLFQWFRRRQEVRAWHASRQSPTVA